jgi:hypothetical protein
MDAIAALLSGLLWAAIAFKGELLRGLVGGVVFSVVAFLIHPLSRRWAVRNEVDRLLYLETHRVSTYVLCGVAAGLWSTSVLVLIPLRARTPELEPWAVGSFACLLFVLGGSALATIGSRRARRLAQQVVELRASAAGRF